MFFVTALYLHVILFLKKKSYTSACEHISTILNKK